MIARVYEAKDGWRWHVRSSNGRIVAESGEAYTRRRDAWRAFTRFTVMLAEALDAQWDWQNAPSSDRVQ